MVLLEAMACGCAILTSPGAYFDEIEYNGAGKIIDRDPMKLATAIRDYVSRGREYMSRLGQNGRDFVASRYTWDSVADDYVKLASELIEAKGNNESNRNR
jgi:glycosyltransferase involved in cell wall biosynthesis